MVLVRLASNLGTVCSLGRGLLLLTGLSLAMDSVGLVWRGLRGLAEWRRRGSVKKKIRRNKRKSCRIRKSIIWLNKNSSRAGVKLKSTCRININQTRTKRQTWMIKDFKQENFIANKVEETLSMSVSKNSLKRKIYNMENQVKDEVENILEISGLSTDTVMPDHETI